MIEYLDLIAIVILGCAYSVMIEPEEILDFIPRFLLKTFKDSKIKKPLGHCAKCTFGWLALIYYMVAYYDQYIIFNHIIYVSTTISLIFLWNKKVVG